jgi:hypothetical protein
MRSDMPAMLAVRGARSRGGQIRSTMASFKAARSKRVPTLGSGLLLLPLLAPPDDSRYTDTRYPSRPSGPDGCPARSGPWSCWCGPDRLRRPGAAPLVPLHPAGRDIPELSRDSVTRQAQPGRPKVLAPIRGSATWLLGCLGPGPSGGVAERRDVGLSNQPVETGSLEARPRTVPRYSGFSAHRDRRPSGQLWTENEDGPERRRNHRRPFLEACRGRAERAPSAMPRPRR